MESARLEIIEDDLSIKLLSYAKYIKSKSFKLNKEYVIKTNNQINDILIDALYEEELEAFEKLPFIFDAIKNKLISLDRNKDKEEIELLKLTKKKFLDTYELYKINSVIKPKNNNSYSEIINYFLLAEKNYLELKNILEQDRRTVNTRINGNHVVIHILDLYIENFEKMLKKEKHISKDYLREIYLLFAKNKWVAIPKEDRNKIDQKLNEFKIKVKQTIKKRVVFNQTLLEIDSLKSKNLIPEKNTNILTQEVCWKLNNQISHIKSSYEDLMNDPSRVDLFEENNICIGAGNAAYSLIEKEDKTIIKLHVLDIRNFVKPGTQLDRHLYNCLVGGILPDREISELLIFINGRSYPTITYELEVAKNGVLGELNIYQSKINIKTKLGELSYLPDEYKKLFRKISNQIGMPPEYRGVKDITHVFETAFSKKISQYMYEHRIPFIYSGSKYQTIKDSNNINNDLIGCLQYLNKNELKNIKKIIEDHNDSFHYSSRYLGDDGKYSLAITNPISYLNFEYQRTIEMFIFDKDKDQVELSNLKRKMEKRNESLAGILNSSINYVDPKSMLENKGRIKTYRDIDKRF